MKTGNDFGHRQEMRTTGKWNFAFRSRADKHLVEGDIVTDRHGILVPFRANAENDQNLRVASSFSRRGRGQNK